MILPLRISKGRKKNRSSLPVTPIRGIIHKDKPANPYGIRFFGTGKRISYWNLYCFTHRQAFYRNGFSPSLFYTKGITCFNMPW